MELPRNQGIRCGFVLLEFAEVGYAHTCTVFETTDEGFVYIDSTDGPDFQVYPEGGSYPVKERTLTVAKLVVIW